MTENEAREKWCPMARMTTVQGNRRWVDGTDCNDPKCIASDCACWVIDSRWEDGRNLPQDKWQGHCGLTRR